jgi:hypothetical protein
MVHGMVKMQQPFHIVAFYDGCRFRTQPAGGPSVRVAPVPIAGGCFISYTVYEGAYMAPISQNRTRFTWELHHGSRRRIAETVANRSEL